MLALCLVALLVTGCCSEQATPALPVVVRPDLPELLPDRRAELRARQSDPARWVYTPSRNAPETVTLPHEDLRLLLECIRYGWVNVEALKIAGGWAR